MHVSLPRRSHRFGLSLQCLLWICFGLLAVVPWQIIRGQDKPDATQVNRDADDWSDNKLDDEISAANTAETVTTSALASTIFRAQGPMPPGGLMPEGMAPPNQQSGTYVPSLDSFTGRSGKAFGTQVRLSGLTGPGIGREHPIFPFEMMPYAFADNNLFFADIRGFTDTKNGFGGNFGGGYRRYVPAIDRIFGVNAYYDYDNTSGALFREVGFGLESLGSFFDIRANAYFPTGSTRQLLDIVNIDGTQSFSGHHILVNQQSTFLNALRGFDTELGVPVRGRIAERHDVRIFGGGYWFEGQKLPSFAGWKARIQANVVPNVAIQLQVSNDNEFKTNVVFGATWSFGGFRQAEEERKTQYDRMTTPVQRQYNMVVGYSHELAKDVTLINPSTNLPYFVEHVDSNAANAGDGTVENPFKAFTDAQSNVPHDIIFVHANSVFNNLAVNLEPGVRVLGEAPNIDHTVSTLELSNISGQGNTLLLPHIATGNEVRPMFLNSPGTGVTLADNSEFSGFQIGNSAVAGTGPAGVGILGSNVQNVTVRQTDVSFSGGEAVFLSGLSGTNTFLGDNFNTPSTGANTFHVTGTIGTITVGSDPLSQLTDTNGQPINTPMNINNTTGAGGIALLVENTTATGQLNFSSSTVNSENDTSGNAILVQNNAGRVVLGDANVTVGSGTALSILNNSGTIVGNGGYAFDQLQGDSILIQGLTSTGQVSFTSPTVTNPSVIQITNRAGRGINMNNNLGNVTFTESVQIGAVGNVNVAAIESTLNKGQITFNRPSGSLDSIDITNGGVGISIHDNPLNGTTAPRFTVNGNTNIVNPAGVGIRIFDDHSTVTFNGNSGLAAGGGNTPMISQRQDIGIQVINDHGTVVFNGVSTISNDNATPTNLPGVDIRGNTDLTSSVTFNSLIVNDPIGPPPVGFGGAGVNIGGDGADANPANVTFTQLQINDATSSVPGVLPYNALFVKNEGQISTTGVSTGLRILGTTIPTAAFTDFSTVTANDGTAVNIQNSVISVRLNQVNSVDSPTNGITLVDNQAFPLTSPTASDLLTNYMFQVIGLANSTLRNGGTISGANGAGVSISQTAGGSLYQTGAINLNQITLNSNTTGMNVTGILSLNVDRSDISSSVTNGLVGTDIPVVNIQRSNFGQNGTTTNHNAIHLVANTPLPTTNTTFPLFFFDKYQWTIQNNNSTDAALNAGFFGQPGAGDLIRVDSGGNTLKIVNGTTTKNTEMILNVLNNDIVVQTGITAFTPSAVFVNWKGIESGTISQNTINMQGNNNGLSFKNDDSTPYNGVTSNFVISNNAFQGNNGGNTGILVNNLGSTNMFIGSNGGNTFDFVTPTTTAGINNSDFAMKFTVFNTSTNISLLNVSNNLITMDGATDQAVVFSSIQAPATITLSGNNIAMTNAQPITGQGIAVQTLSGVVRFNGNNNNIVSVNGATTVPNAAGVVTSDWVILPLSTNTRVGQFFVNGFIVR